MTLEVRPATPETWDDVCHVMASPGDSGRCWCQWFHHTTARWQQLDRDEHRSALRAQLETSPPPGVLGFLDGQPAAWCALAPRTAYRRLQRSRKLTAAGVDGDLGDDTVWSVTCFVVRAPLRRRGLLVPLLEGAVEVAREGGARVVEGYPLDLARRARVGAAELYVGTLGTFLAAGFTEVGRSAPARPVLRRTI